jgi:uncharacterized membrane protein YdjX (TVP38/TMEM64 family)
MTYFNQLKERLNDHSNYTRLLIVLVLVIFIFLVVHLFELYLPGLEKQIQALGTFAFIGFIVLFVVSTPFFVSVDTLCFAAGLLFPLLPGIFYVTIATYIADAVIFTLWGYFFREKVEIILSRHQQFAKLDSIGS